ncbi:serine/threonine-protein phosphatase with EF-hands 2-like isoform X3 [Lineus longissimus]|uniref:serine/threonine-protein phosphatase with EF-hands 2-like isoform X3 n=1 Tax=Lineus longissimus TaxID=88925 RepID=UPI00315C948C
MGCGTSTETSDRRGSDGEKRKKVCQHGLFSWCPSHNALFSNNKASAVVAIKAAVLIQNWYRRYVAKLEAKRRYTWSIFQTIEYAGEQDQLKLYNFFNDMLLHLNTDDGGKNLASVITAGHRPLAKKFESIDEEDEELLKKTDPASIKIEHSYKGPHLQFPLTTAHLDALVEGFRSKHKLHAKYVLELLHETRKVLRERGNIYHASTAIAKQMTVCGDLHGKMDDLFMIFYKNGLPSSSNPYVFNGDFVDRGPHSIETAMLLFACLLVHPQDVYINRGNHEDHIMNLRYGFIKEIMSKYKEHATKIARLFEDVFSWLPLATVIDSKILVCHGGISDRTDLDMIRLIDRHKYASILRPPLTDDDSEDGSRGATRQKVLEEWRQVLDILWSDPKSQPGCKPNTFRGGGSYFGPDITKMVLRKHDLSLLIRSHECKLEGYEFDHDNLVLTVFSASNYYEEGSNKGAYVKFGTDLQPHLIQYMSSKQTGRKLTITQRLSNVEESAIRDLREKICAYQSQLEEEFKKYDNNHKGLIKIADWCTAMEEVLCFNLPWRTLRPQLAKANKAGLIQYASTFEQFKIKNKFSDGGQTVTEALYRNRDNLEMIFRAIDKDNSGVISMDEFENACNVLSQHTGAPLQQESVHDLARSIDINKDGFIDFNEFLEAFRLVNIDHRNSLTLSKPSVQSDGTIGDGTPSKQGLSPTPTKSTPSISTTEVVINAGER